MAAGLQLLYFALVNMCRFSNAASPQGVIIVFFLEEKEEL